MTQLQENADNTLAVRNAHPSHRDGGREMMAAFVIAAIVGVIVGASFGALQFFSYWGLLLIVAGAAALIFKRRAASAAARQRDKALAEKRFRSKLQVAEAKAKGEFDWFGQ